MTRFAGRVCLVTGATGIAAASAERLAAEGASVFVASRTAKHGRELVDRITGRGGSAVAHQADLADQPQVEAAVAACETAFGRIDGLLSVAGGSGRRFGDGPIHQMTADAWEATLRLNLTTQALVSAAVVRRMLDQAQTAPGSRGAIVLVSSVLAGHPVPHLFETHAYAAAKGGIIALALAMAAAYATKGIRVNALAPALTDTPMAARAAADPASIAFAREKQPLAAGLIGADDVAGAALFLLSDDARQVTGQVLLVDGGWSVTHADPATER
jgi:NAD(P)-dependent dehydrogenase (short-subunit alcohol dehydrogenase family)